MALKEFIETLCAGSDLDSEQAKELMLAMIGGGAPEAQIAGALVALRAKGASAVELAAFARALQESAVTVEHACEDLVDTCGTGGGSPSFNLSTGAALVAAAAGAHIAKHGNRRVTSQCGSADVLEALGVSLMLEPGRASRVLQEVGIVFLFAPAHHPGMKAVGPVRQSLGIRTVFNQLGPLANPARARRQLIGVYERALALPMAQALKLMGGERALVVHGEDGLDEISPTANTFAVELVDGQISERVIEPGAFGQSPVPVEAIRPEATPEANAEILLQALSGADEQRSAALVPNAAAALYLGGQAASLAEGAEMAREAIRSGAARAKLDELVKASRRT